ncbi:hypothetical protein KJ656_02895 [bacterium]|nr:hypothetical protein [bacterium]
MLLLKKINAEKNHDKSSPDYQLLYKIQKDWESVNQKIDANFSHAFNDPKPDPTGEADKDLKPAKLKKMEIRSLIDCKGNPFTKTKFCQMLYENMKLGRSVFKTKNCTNENIEIEPGQRNKQNLANYISDNFLYKNANFDSNTVMSCLKTYSLSPEDELYLKKAS